jgi:CheY-like chemotaxis protein
MRQRNVALLPVPIDLDFTKSLSGNLRIHQQDNPTRTVDVSKSISEKPRVMIVDDEKDITMVFKSALENSGFNVEVFNDPVAALSNFRPDYYDLILIDIRMPTMSGFELYSELARKDKDVKARFISAFEVYKEELRKYLPNENQDRIIRKPISTRELIRIVREETGA